MFEISRDLRAKVLNFGGKQIIEIKNFYNDPDSVRDYALDSRKYTAEEYPDLLAFAIGRRICEDDLRLKPEMEPVFRQLCQHPEWHIEFDEDHHEYMWSGMRFMVNATNNQEIVNANKPFIAHKDGPERKWACVIYLNTPEECEGGTEFYSEDIKLEYSSSMEYNKAVLYDANMIHGAVMKKDMFKTCDRLVQVMFM